MCYALLNGMIITPSDTLGDRASAERGTSTPARNAKHGTTPGRSGRVHGETGNPAGQTVAAAGTFERQFSQVLAALDIHLSPATLANLTVGGRR